MRFARINATSDGDNEIVAASAVPDDMRIRVLNYSISTNAAGVCSFLSTGGTTFASWEFADSATAHTFNGTMSSPAFDLPPGEGLEVNVASSVDALGHLCYELV